MVITSRTSYYVNGKQFPSNEAAQEYCEELLAEKLVLLLEKNNEALSPKQRIKFLHNIHQLSFPERQAFADMFIVITEEV